MIPESSAVPSQRSALGLPGVLWRVRAVVYGVVYLLALAAPGATGGSRLDVTVLILGAGLLPFLVSLARPEWALEVSAGVDLLVGFVLWWQLPAMPGAGLAMTMWAVVLIAVATRHHIEDVLLPVAIALEVVKLMIVAFGPDRPVGAGVSEMFRAPFDEIIFALAQTGLVLGVYFAARALAHSHRLGREAEAGGEQRNTAMVAASPAAMVVVVSGSVVFANPAAERLLGAPQSELVGSDFFNLVPDSAVPGARAAIQRAVAANHTVTVAGEPLVTADGATLRIGLQIAPMTYDGQPAVQVVLADLPAEQPSAGALQASAERYRNLFERIPVALYRTSTDGAIVDVNPALLELMGYEDIDALRSHPATEFYVDPDDRSRMAKLMIDDGRVVVAEAEMVRSDGSTFWARDTARVVGDEGARHFEGALVDVTERRQGEARLREQARLQEALAHLGQIALDTTDPSELFAESVAIVAEELRLELAGVVLRTGEGSYEPAAAVGWPSEGEGRAHARLEALARYAVDQESPVMVSAVRDAADNGGSLPGKGVAIALSGSDRPIGALIALGPRGGGFRTEQVHFLQSTQAILAAAIGRATASSRLEELVRSKDEFVASISHELRTPLTVVAGMVDELNGHWQEFTADEVNDLLSHVVEESRDMQDLIEDLLVAARADIGTVSVTLESVAVRESVDGVVAGLTPRPSQELTVAGGGERAEADPVRLRQIIRNLVSNAIRYGGDHIDVGVVRENGHIHITVEDDGTGIPDGQWEQVFQPYARAHDTAEQPNSVGLGLTVSRKLARLMGGDLEYRCEGGSVFDLSLPAADGACDPAGDPVGEPSS